MNAAVAPDTNMDSYKTNQLFPSSRVYNNERILAAYHCHCSNPDEDSKSLVDRPLRDHPDVVAQVFTDMPSHHEDPNAIHWFFRKYFMDKPADSGQQVTPSDYTESAPSFTNSENFPEKARELAQHLKEIWPTLCRSTPASGTEIPYVQTSVIPLPYPFFVAGGRFREVYYWDTYWIVKGLLACDMKASAMDSVENLLWLVKYVGFVPNANRVYYVNRSQPPLLTAAVGQMYEKSESADVDWLRRVVPLLEREYRTFTEWHASDYKHHPVLSVYRARTVLPRPESWIEDAKTVYQAKGEQVEINDVRKFDSCSILKMDRNDPRAAELYGHLASAAESGWDFSSRWFDPNKGLSSTHTTEIIPVCLNAILIHAEKQLSRFHAILADRKTPEDDVDHSAQSKTYAENAKRRANAVNALMWDEQKLFWIDFDITVEKRTDVIAASGLMMLWAEGWPTKWARDDATKFVKNFNDNCSLMQPGGLVATENCSVEQWDCPNMWPPLADFAVTGFENLERAFPGCGAKDVAKDIAEKTLRSMYRGWKSSSFMHEKYDGTKDNGARGGGGEYTPQVGFGWTNGVALDFMRRGYWADDA